MSTATTIQLTGLDGVLDLLKSLPAEVVSKNGGPVRSALRKGARVILDEEKVRLQIATSNLSTNAKGSTGLLLDSLAIRRGRISSGEKAQVFVKKKTYPRSGKGEKVTTRMSARLLEYGSSQQKAEPWIRPAFAAKAPQAIATIERELIAGLDRIVKKLSRGV